MLQYTEDSALYCRAKVPLPDRTIVDWKTLTEIGENAELSILIRFEALTLLRSLEEEVFHKSQVIVFSNCSSTPDGSFASSKHFAQVVGISYNTLSKYKPKNAKILSEMKEDGDPITAWMTALAR